MRKIALILVLFAASLSAQAQKNIIKTNPVSLAFGNFNVDYERVISESSSFTASASYMYKLLGLEVAAGGLGLGYRYYITHAKKDIPNGFYVNPFVSANAGGLNFLGDSVKFFNFGVAASLGYQWVWDSGFALDLGAGPFLNMMKTSANVNINGTLKDSNVGISPYLRVAIGYAF